MDIIRDLSHLKNHDIDLFGLIKKKVGNGARTIFWAEAWKGDITFKFLYLRAYELETCKKISVGSKLAHDNHPNMQDRWVWSLEGSRDFSVSSVRGFIDDHMLPEVSSKFRWRNVVPIKINVHAWKVRLDYLPTRLNLSRMGLDIQSILCPNCGKFLEPSSHIFFACPMVRDIYRKIASWWDYNVLDVTSYEEWDVWLSSLQLSSKRKQVLKGVFYIAWWIIWNFQNKSLFSSRNPSKAILFDDIVARSFQWCRHKGRFNFSWVDWLRNSLSCKHVIFDCLASY
ncbi:RNA-directed DNA polymerase, eukaryota, reverse transcriptase zinc-binding domain protein [Tanacetum coccineum]